MAVKLNEALAQEAENDIKYVSAWNILKMLFIKKKVYIGHEMRVGWLGKLPFYLFFCFSCGEVAKDYPHGYTNYLLCPHCGARDKLKPKDMHISEE